ncbi:hypothetical protein QTN25_002076 [Entamoeba marina]
MALESVEQIIQQIFTFHSEIITLSNKKNDLLQELQTVLNRDFITELISLKQRNDALVQQNKEITDKLRLKEDECNILNEKINILFASEELPPKTLSPIPENIVKEVEIGISANEKQNPKKRGKPKPKKANKKVIKTSQKARIEHSNQRLKTTKKKVIKKQQKETNESVAIQQELDVIKDLMEKHYGVPEEKVELEDVNFPANKQTPKQVSLIDSMKNLQQIISEMKLKMDFNVDDPEDDDLDSLEDY